MKRHFAVFAALAAQTFALNAIADDIVVFDKSNGYANVGAVGGKLETANGASLAGGGSIHFMGDWDLSKNLDIALDIENVDKTKPVKIAVFLYNSEAQKNTDGNPTLVFQIPPNHRGEYVVQWPALLYPEMATKFKIMRNNPYLLCDRQVIPDVKNIKLVNVGRYWAGSNAKFIVHKIVAKDSSKREVPEWFKLDEKHFFPFIDKYGQFKFKTWKGKTTSDAQLKAAAKEELAELEKNPSPAGLDKFGGLASGFALNATGHFRVEKVGGKWWLIDPEGNLFWSHGVVRVTPSSAITPLDGRRHYFEYLPNQDEPFAQFYTTKDELLAPYYTTRGLKETFDFSAANIFRKYGDDWRNKYAEVAHKRLRSWGLNTIANSSDKTIFLMDKTPYIDRFEIRCASLSNSSGWWAPFHDPFDDGFRKSVADNLQSRKEQLDDPWCIGFFVDNEINWGSPTTLAECTLVSPATLAAKKAFVAQLKQKYGDVKNLNAVWKTNFSTWNDILDNKITAPAQARDDMLAFNTAIAEKYFKTISEEIKKVAPNKLYMGCRFAGSNERIMRVADKYCDVISFNIYRDNLNDLTLPQGIDKPIMIGEFHFGALDRGLFHPGLIGKANQQERAQAYADYVVSALRHKNVIGTHWHQFSDQATTGRFDGENFQVGFTDVCDNPYPETIAKIREVGYKLYDTRLNSK